MKRTSLPITMLILLSLACSLGGQVDFTPTETAIAAQVMTQVAGTAQPPEPGQQPAGGEQPPAGQPGGEQPPDGAAGGPEFNPFENMTAEQETCLREAWGDEAFEAISSFQRLPDPQTEGPAMAECVGPPPGAPDGQPGAPGAPGGGTGQEPGGGHQVGQDQTYYTTSTDGLTWAEGALLSEAASVPDVIRTSKGETWAYWVDFSDFTGPNTENIGVARSADDGNTWELLGNAVFTDLGEITPVDPNVIELPDGSLRMYFYDIAVFQGAHPIYSAVSDDGINFTLEEGVRFSMENIFDPDVIQLPDGTYRMYLNSEDILSASSPDGLTFTADEGVRVEKGAVPGAILMPDGSVRLYACVNGISVFESQDGLTFSSLQERVVIGQGIICDPSVTATPAGYLMVYKYNPGQ